VNPDVTLQQEKKKQKYKGQKTGFLGSKGNFTMMRIKEVNQGFARLMMMLLFILRFVRLLRLMIRRMDGLLRYTKSFRSISFFKQPMFPS